MTIISKQQLYIKLEYNTIKCDFLHSQEINTAESDITLITDRFFEKNKKKTLESKRFSRILSLNTL